MNVTAAAASPRIGGCCGGTGTLSGHAVRCAATSRGTAVVGWPVCPPGLKNRRPSKWSLVITRSTATERLGRTRRGEFDGAATDGARHVILRPQLQKIRTLRERAPGRDDGAFDADVHRQVDRVAATLHADALGPAGTGRVCLVDADACRVAERPFGAERDEEPRHARRIGRVLR